MGPIVLVRMFIYVKPRDVIYLKFVDKFFTSLTKLWFKAKGSISSTIKENLLLYCRTFLAFASLSYFNIF